MAAERPAAPAPRARSKNEHHRVDTADARPRARARVRVFSRRHHLPRSHLHLGRRAVHDGGPAADRARDERGVQRVYAGLFTVRSALGMARRRQRAAPRADANCVVVVGLHHADRGRAGLSFAGGDPLPVRRGRSGRVPEHGAQSVALVPAQRTRPRQWRHAARLARRRHDLGAAGTAGDFPVGLARIVCDLRPHRRGVGRRLARVVSRSARGASVDFCGRSGVDPAGRADVARATSRRRGARSSVREISTPFARCILRSGTACISTSPGCPRI